MKIVIATKVDADLQTVANNFSEELFKALNPPFPPVKLLRYDGSKKGDKVILELNFLFFKQTWVSYISEDHSSTALNYFIDIGEKLPFFLKSWKHKHIMIQDRDQTVIEDNIEYTTGTILTDWLMLPALKLQFLYRKPIYKKFFTELQSHQSENLALRT